LPALLDQLKQSINCLGHSVSPTKDAPGSRGGCDTSAGRQFAASAQTQPTTPGTNATPQELAKSIHNPFEDFVKVALQSTTGFNIGPHHNAGDSLNLQPTIPFSLTGSGT